MSALIEPVSEAARRELVLSLAMFGVPDDIIARKLRMPLPELRRRYAQELQDGGADGVIAAMETLYRMATARRPEAAAVKLYLQHMGAVAAQGRSQTRNPPKRIGEDTARQILKTIVGTPREVAEFLRMRRELQKREDAEEGVVISGESRLDADGDQVDF